MTYKLTNSGIIKLTEGRYGNRYNKLPNFEILANGTVKKIVPAKSTITEVSKKRKKAVKKPSPFVEIIAPTAQPEKKVNGGRSLRGKAALIKNRIICKIQSIEKNPKLSFITITFPALTDDKTCYRLLNTWLTIVRTNTSKFSYLWVAERQQNSTIHFHLCTTNYIPIVKYNLYMRNAIKDLVKKKVIIWNQFAASQYNGIDIAKDRKTKRVINFADNGKRKSLVQYLTKYITKNETKSKNSVWSCSSDYSNLIIEIHCTKSELIYFLKGVNLKTDCIRYFDYSTFIPWEDKPPDKLIKHIAEINKMLFAQ